MKPLIILLFLVLTLPSFSQQAYGIAQFTLPEGWGQSEENGSLVLSPKNREMGSCQILISKTEKEVVNSTETYLSFRKKMTENWYTFGKDTRALAPRQENGITLYMSGGQAREGVSKTFFYSLTNGESSFFVQLITDNNACIQAFNDFLLSLRVEGSTGETAGKANQGIRMARRKKAAPAPVPAAPAPMM